MNFELDMPRLIVIVGPTAVGKTAAAISLAEMLHTEIVSCDSRQFYSELKIGVARPSDEELATVPHHFIACRPVTNPYNVYTYEHEALALLDTLFGKFDTVVAVGGSGLYVDALCKGINYMPDPTPELRASLKQRIDEGGLPDMLEELKKLDPDYYAVVDHRNPIRIQRALEIIHTAGVPCSQLLQPSLPQRPFEIVKVAITADRDTLRDRIYRRVDQMMEQGLLDEAETLLPLRNLSTLNTVGYKELFAYFDGSVSLADAVMQIKNHTWQYAKKQLTWLKRYDDISWIESHSASKSLSEMFVKN